ncbi:hypothetical protein [Pannonibacter indicus]|uniref:hypothetical protein n=1 Tax=Pannonibacter indicus TaxID=466044 RepID=UPI00391B7CC2
MLDDLETPMYTQKQVLLMLPELKPKALQNWAARGILDVGEQKPGRSGKRLYTPVGVIALNFMQKVGVYGVPPLQAADMAYHVAAAAIEFWAAKPEIIRLPGEKNSLWIPVDPSRMKSFRKARVVIYETHALKEGSMLLFDETTPLKKKSYFKFADDLEDATERLFNTLSLVVEVDYIIAQTINRMFLLEAGAI